MLPDPRPYFAHLVDPRRETRNKLHKLEDILMIVFSAAVSGIEDWVGMEEFGKQKWDWLKSFLDLTNGIPSHDTLRDRPVGAGGVCGSLFVLGEGGDTQLGRRAGVFGRQAATGKPGGR